MNQYDPQAKCPKCGGDDVSSNYHPKIDLWRYRHGCRTYDTSPDNQVLAEHIGRRCQRCHYSWPELPLDAQQATGTPSAEYIMTPFPSSPGTSAEKPTPLPVVYVGTADTAPATNAAPGGAPFIACGSVERV